jgi:acyl carrier protein
MPRLSTEDIETRIIDKVRKYVGTDELVENGDMFARDLGITGLDSVELRNDVEREFRIDLSPLIEEQRTSTQGGIVRSILDAVKGAPRFDVSASMIARYISESQE